VPFVSTAHYSLLAALHHWGIDPGRVQILNLSPPQIAAAWARGDIDAAYVWDPALGRLKASGKVLVGSDVVGDWGAPTFDVWVARRDFMKADPASVAAFVKVTLRAEATYRRDGKGWTAGSRQVTDIAAITGARPEDIPPMLATNDYPDAAQQAAPALLGGGLAADLANTAAFLEAQGKVDRVLPDYAAFLDPAYVRADAGF
jgi:taurine transport system substrate-binding protein